MIDGFYAEIHDVVRLISLYHFNIWAASIGTRRGTIAYDDAARSTVLGSTLSPDFEPYPGAYAYAPACKASGGDSAKSKAMPKLQATNAGAFDGFIVKYVAPNYQGLWWNPLESGWGINFAHQGDIIFATWFTYGADNQPQWYTIRARQDGGRRLLGTGLELHRTAVQYRCRSRRTPTSRPRSGRRRSPSPRTARARPSTTR